MTLFKNPNHLPNITVLCGAAGLLLRRCQYTFAVDTEGLLTPNHPFTILLTLFSFAFLAFLGIAVWRLDGSAKYEDNFAPSTRSMAGHMLAGWGIFLTVMLNRAPMPGILGNAWNLLGLASLPCLILAGIYRKNGKQPFFLLHLIPCLFLVFHIVNHYQTWSGNPQLQDDLYTVLGTMAALFFAFYTTSFDVDLGKRRLQLFMGLSAVYLLMVSIPTTQYLFFCVGCACWAGSGLCRLIPVPKPIEEPKEEGGDSL